MFLTAKRPSLSQNQGATSVAIGGKESEEKWLIMGMELYARAHPRRLGWVPRKEVFDRGVKAYIVRPPKRERVTFSIPPGTVLPSGKSVL